MVQNGGSRVDNVYTPDLNSDGNLGQTVAADVHFMKADVPGNVVAKSRRQIINYDDLVPSRYVGIHNM